MSDSLKDNIKVDGDTITIYGIRYSGEVFRNFGKFMSEGQLFRLDSRKDGVLTLTKINEQVQYRDFLMK